MQTLRFHFNQRARRKKADQDFQFWMLLLSLIAQIDRLQNQVDQLTAQLGYSGDPPSPG